MFIGEIKDDGQFDVVWKTEGLVPGDAWSKELDGSRFTPAQPPPSPALEPKCGFRRCCLMNTDAATVVQLLREFASRTSLRGGNPHRAKAYARAAESLAAIVVPLDQMSARLCLDAS